MDAKQRIARRVAQELRDGDIVNLGIGLPTMVANYLPEGIHITLQSENGFLGLGPVTTAHPDLVNAGGQPCGVLPGAAMFDSAMSFALIRGGHIDACVLGGLQVDEEANLANWVVPGKMVPGMGGAMDLVTGSRKVIIAMEHCAKDGSAKILRRCTMPLTAQHAVHMLVTELAVFRFIDGKMWLTEIADGCDLATVRAKTEARFEVARRVPGSDYPLLIACAYIGFLTWGGGFSGSMPLLAATPGNPVEHIAGLIPVGDTLFSGFNIFITVALIVVMPFITRMMMPKPSDVVSIDPKLLMEEADFQKQLPKDAPPSERLEESRILTLIIGALGIAYLAMYFSEHGFNITINTVNLMFMIAGLLLHKTPMAYMRAISAAARSTAGILVQFPFYAGIQLMMEHSGLGGLITEFFINVANKDTFPVMTFFSSALINFAVPSGGGHWVIQGPFVIPAAQALGADLGKSVMAIAYGEQWMNMAQPFWALPALAIAGLGVRDIMGYCITALFFSGVIFVIGLTLF